MQHFDIVEWTDYRRGLLDPITRKRMAAHLERGCRQCGDIVETLDAIVADARDQSSPPKWAVRSVLAYFSVGERHAHDRLRRLPVRITFDSLRRPAVAGLRNDGVRGRHLVFEAQQYTVDARLEYGGGRGLSVVGQVVSGGGVPVPRVPAFLLMGGEIVERDLTTRHGEFQLECMRGGRVRLCLSVGSGQVIEVDLDRRPQDADPAPDASPEGRWRGDDPGRGPE